MSSPNVQNMLRQAQQAHQAGHADVAGRLYQEILNQQPNHPVATHFLGLLKYQMGDAATGMDLIRRSIQSNPSIAAFHSNLGLVLSRQGNDEAAVAAYSEALRLDRGHFDALNGLANLFLRNHRINEAIGLFIRAVQLAPTQANVHNNLGNALLAKGDIEAALKSYRQACKLDPAYVEPRVNSGNAHAAAGRFREAIDSYRAALKLQPELAGAHYNIGHAYYDDGDLDPAIAAFREALRIDPTFSEALNNLAGALSDIGRLDEAIKVGESAVTARPDSAIPFSNLLYIRLHQPDVPPDALAAEHRRWAEIHADPLARDVAVHPNDRDPGRRLRVGYVSPYFRNHAVNFFVEPILREHDRGRFEVFCYSDVKKPDDATRRIQSFNLNWRDTHSLSHAQLAERILADKINLLVDLCGHLSGHRLLTFARRPAPVQLTYIGYQATTGMSQMDYRITDDWADPPGQTEHLHTEKLMRLPESFFCYQPSTDAPDISDLPAIKRGYITFGSFNMFSKVTSTCLKTWCEILQKVSTARLLLLVPRSKMLEQDLTQRFEAAGIARDRWELAYRRPRNEYLRLFKDVDIALDSIPFNGHTTTCDALWMGVPTITCSGNAYVSRFGGTALQLMSLEDLATTDLPNYIAKAVELSQNLDRLSSLRSGLRKQMSESVITNAPLFTRRIESAYRDAWTKWCSKIADSP